MAVFNIENGPKGPQWCTHTATGYECSANHPTNKEILVPEVHFIMRYVMGTDNIPCMEIGFKGLQENDFAFHAQKLARLLTDAGYQQVLSFCNHALPEHAFMPSDDAAWGSITVKVVHRKNTLSDLADIIKECIPSNGYAFVKEQEEVDNVLFKSMLYTMGPALMKGGYDQQGTMEKIADLANALGAEYQPHQLSQSGHA